MYYSHKKIPWRHKFFREHTMDRKSLSKSAVSLWVLAIVTGFSYAVTIPTPSSYVTDQANIIDDEEQNQLEEKIATLQKNTTDEIAILTLGDLEGEDISQLGTEIAQKREIGKDNEDNGILILIAPTERERRIDVWYGLEGTIPDAIAFRLGSQILPDYFRQEQYGEWLIQLTDKLIAILEGREDAPINTASTDEDSNRFGYLVAMTFVIIILTKKLRKNITKNLQKGATAVWGTVAMVLFGIVLFGTSLITIFFIRFLIRRLVGLFWKTEIGWSWRYGTPWRWWGGWFGWWSFGWWFGWFGWGSFGGGWASWSR